MMDKRIISISGIFVVILLAVTASMVSTVHADGISTTSCYGVRDCIVTTTTVTKTSTTTEEDGGQQTFIPQLGAPRFGIIAKGEWFNGAPTFMIITGYIQYPYGGRVPNVIMNYTLTYTDGTTSKGQIYIGQSWETGFENRAPFAFIVSGLQPAGYAGRTNILVITGTCLNGCAQSTFTVPIILTI